MNYFLFIIKSAAFDFSRNKGRTFLTSLGILIGVLSVVLLTAFGLGLKKYIADQFESLGTNLLRVLPGQPLRSGGFSGGPSSFGTIHFEEKDVVKLSRLRSLEVVVPVYYKSMDVVAGKNTEFATVYMTNSDVFKAINLNTEYGAPFTKQDVEKRSKVVVIGPKIAENLFADQKAAVDRSLKIEGQTFKVLGVLGAKGGGFGGPDLDSFIYMPYKTGYIFNTDKQFIVLILKVKSDQSIETAKTEANDILLKRFKKDDFSIVEQGEILSAINSIFAVLNTVLIAIAAISLVVGGIGIMNIMYVTVTERIKEIGIRRALGARKKDILYQFLVESVILSLLG